MPPNSANIVHISARAPWWRLPWRDLLAYRELLWFIVRRDLTVVYKQSLLGPVWFALTPIVTTLVFTVFFGRVAKLRTDGLPRFLFYYTGTIVWTYFSSCLMAVAGTLAGNAAVFSKVYFPRLIMPLASITLPVARLLLSLLLYGVAHGWLAARGEFAFVPSYGLLLLPLVVLQCAMAGLGAGLWLSVLTSKYRDLAFAAPLLVQFWMYATPIVYPASYVRPDYWWLWGFNPITPAVETARWALLGRGSLDPSMVLIGVAVAALLCVSGVLVFQRVQRNYLDVI